jgi:hypothetical protein
VNGILAQTAGERSRIADRRARELNPQTLVPRDGSDRRSTVVNRPDHSAIAFRPAAVIFTWNNFGRSDPRSLASPANTR